MNKISIGLVFLLLVSTGVSAQYESGMTYPDSSQRLPVDSSSTAFIFANTITAQDLENHLSILASDEFEGRETGTEGNNKAARYIAEHFKNLGIKPHGLENSYYQNVSFNKTYWQETKMTVNNSEFRHLWDFMTFPTINEELSINTDEVVFLGYGIDDPNYSDYKGNDLNGKIIMINKGEPVNKDSISYITGTKEPSEWSANMRKKLKLAKSKGVKLVLIIEEDLRKFLDKNRRFLVSPSLELGDGKIKNQRYANHMYVSSNIAREIIGKRDKKIKKWRSKLTRKGKPCDIKLKPDLAISLKKRIDLIQGQNVCAYIEGTDKKDELVVVSAHYDHLGKRNKDIFNGADDNGTGTAAILEFAEALSLASKKGSAPRRSILLLLVTGEEKGLLGSRYYAEDPLYPIENTVANVNIDMIGRVDEKHSDDPNYIYVIGSDRLSTDLHAINERINQESSQLVLDYQYNSENDPNRYYYRSDHYNFAKKGIPAIFFFSGVHEDYHRPSDTVDKIMFDEMTNVSRHIFRLTWDLANREDRIKVNVGTED